MPKRTFSAANLTPDDITPDEIRPQKVIAGDEETTGQITVMSPPDPVVTCHIHETPLGFMRTSDFIAHYHRDHEWACGACEKSFPTERTKDMHEDEHHNLLIGMMRDRGENTFRCFEESCAQVLASQSVRARHCVVEHGYEKGFDFQIVNDGSGIRTSLLVDGICGNGNT